MKRQRGSKLWHHCLEGSCWCWLVGWKWEVELGSPAMYKPSLFFLFALEINTQQETAVLWVAVKVLGTNGSSALGTRGIQTVFLSLWTGFPMGCSSVLLHLLYDRLVFESSTFSYFCGEFPEGEGLNKPSAVHTWSPSSHSVDPLHTKDFCRR